MLRASGNAGLSWNTSVRRASLPFRPLLGPLALAKSHAWAAAVFVDEFDANQRTNLLSHRGPRRLRDVVRAGVAPKRIPGRSAGDPMNSMPATSKAALTPSSVDERLGGTPSTASNLLIVLAVTPDLFANSSVVQRRAFLAERIWAPVIIDKP
jgi:hypothetical protein